MAAPTPRCCPRCRLLQPERTCVDCGAGTYARVDAPPDLLFDPQAMYVDVNKPLGYLRGFGAIVWVFGAIFGGAWVISGLPNRFTGTATIALMVLVFAPMFAFGVFKKATPRRLFVPLPAPKAEQGAEIVGRARARASGARGELVRYLVARADEALFAHQRQSVDLIIDGEEGRQVAVTGIVHVAGPGQPASRDAFGEWADCLPAEQQLVSHALETGDLVEVSGRGREEQVTDGYRDHKILVLKGEAGHPVIIRRV